MNKIELTMEQEKINQELINNMKQEIKTMEFKINHYSTVKKLKIFKGITKIATPYILTAGIVFGVFSLFDSGYIKQKKNLNIKTIRDSNGNVRTEEKYADFDKNDNILIYYTKWQKDNDSYYRRVDTYVLGDIKEESIEKMLDGNITNINEVLGNPFNSVIERQNKDDIDINEKNYIEIISYDKDENNFIYVKEDAEDNFFKTFYFCFITLIISGSIFVCTENLREKILKEMRESDFVLDEEKKKLKIKKANYDRLMR